MRRFLPGLLMATLLASTAMAGDLVITNVQNDPSRELAMTDSLALAAPAAEPAKLPEATATAAYDDQLFLSAQHAEQEKAAEKKQAAALKRTDVFTTQKRGAFGRRTHEHTTVIEVDQDGQPTERSSGNCANGQCGNMAHEMIQMETGYSGSGCGAGGCGSSGMSRREMRRMSKGKGGGCSGGGCN